MRRSVLSLFCLITSFWALGQEDNLRQIVRSTFYHQEVFNKIFFEYNGNEMTFMEGYKKGMKGAFILPDTTLQNRIPNLLQMVGTSHATEKHFMTITLLSNPNGNVYITSHVMDPAIMLFIHFDKLLMTGRTSKVEFHTTSFPDSNGSKRNHFKVDCELVKRKKGWKIRDLHVEPIECCTPLWSIEGQ